MIQQSNFDPWSGYRLMEEDNRQNIQQGLAVDANRRANETQTMTKDDWEAKKAARELELRDAQGLRNATMFASKPQEVTTQAPNPAMAEHLNAYTDEALAADRGGPGATAAGLGQLFQAEQPLPPATVPVTEQKTPSIWKQQKDIADAAMKMGHPKGPEMQASAHKAIVDEAAKYLALGDGPSAVKFMNDHTGSSLEYLGKKGNIATVAGKDGTYMYDELNMSRDIQSGMSLSQAWEKNAAKVDQKAVKTWEQLPDLVSNGVTTQVQEDQTTGERKYHTGTKPPGNGSGALDKIVSREAVKDIPKLRREARVAEASERRIDQMMPAIESGSAGGLRGNILSSLSTFFDTPATSEAALFKQMAKLGAGQLRATVIGPGSVSNYENQLLQSIGGGGTEARSATIKLLKFYKREAGNTINVYHDALDSADSVTGGQTSKGFGRISRAPIAKKGFKIQSREVNGKTEYREVPE